MAVGVDETRNDNLAADVDLAFAAVFAERSDDAVAADRNVALDEFTADEIENPPALQHKVGLREPLPLLDGATKKGDGVAHPCVPRQAGREMSEHCFRLDQYVKRSVGLGCVRRPNQGSAQRRFRFDAVRELPSR